MSTSAAVPYFQRAWQIKLTPQTQSNGIILSSDQFAVPLRATFEIAAHSLAAGPSGGANYWTCEMTLYNIAETLQAQLQTSGVPQSSLAAGLQNQLTLLQQSEAIQMGDLLQISAGYKSGSGGPFTPEANQIWSGHVFQPIWTRENVVDYKITLRCLVGLLQDQLSAVNISVAAGKTPYQAIQQICDSCGIQIDQTVTGQSGVDSQTLSTQKFSRAQVYSGKPLTEIAKIAAPYKLQMWLSPNGLNVRSLESTSTAVPDYVYGPPNLPGVYAPAGSTTGVIKKTLLGVPEQTQQGVTFKVLMDAGVRIGDVVGLAPGTVINQFPYTIPGYPAILDKGGDYVVAGIRHVGDTRGGNADWYTEITGLTNQFFRNFLNITSPAVG